MAIWSFGGLQNGITGKAGSRPRIGATAESWGDAGVITDFYFSPVNTGIITASQNSLLTQHGWTNAGTLSIVTGSGADFLSATDYGSPTALLMDTSGERSLSPYCFGSYATMRKIRQQLGWTPSKLIAEWVSFYTTSSNADTTGGVGFVKAGGAIQTAADHIAVITSDATNFVLRSGTASATTTIANAIDTVTPHIWRITLDMGTLLATYMKDGVTFGTGGASGTGVVAISQDQAPYAFGMAVTSSNVLSVGDVHIWYDV